MLKTKYLTEKINYNGTQLRPLWNYLDHDLLGSSVVAFTGACQISFEHMVDGEDLKQQAAICGDHMLHFIFEIFDQDLFSAVLVQRLFASILADLIFAQTRISLRRSGDDLYLDSTEGERKLSISIATKSVNSTLIHFALNLTNDGTPVRTCCLQDFGIESGASQSFALQALSRISEELQSVQIATWKVRTL